MTNSDQCARCKERGPDMRTLRMGCTYDLMELKIPLTEEKAGYLNMYTMPICKECRADWLKDIVRWFHHEPSHVCLARAQKAYEDFQNGLKDLDLRKLDLRKADTMGSSIQFEILPPKPSDDGLPNLGQLAPGHFYRLSTGHTPLVVLEQGEEGTVSRYMNVRMGELFEKQNGIQRKDRDVARLTKVVVLDIVEPMKFRERVPQ